MSTMVERVARAMAAEELHVIGDALDVSEYRGMARAAIAVIREPFDEYIKLLEAENKALMSLAYVHGYRCHRAVKRGKELRAVIDAALEGGGK